MCSPPITHTKGLTQAHTNLTRCKNTHMRNETGTTNNSERDGRVKREKNNTQLVMCLRSERWTRLFVFVHAAMVLLCSSHTCIACKHNHVAATHLDSDIRTAAAYRANRPYWRAWNELHSALKTMRGGIYFCRLCRRENIGRPKMIHMRWAIKWWSAMASDIHR